MTTNSTEPWREGVERDMSLILFIIVISQLIAALENGDMLRPLALAPLLG
jgi:hypothetical protein